MVTQEHYPEDVAIMISATRVRPVNTQMKSKIAIRRAKKMDAT